MSDNFKVKFLVEPYPYTIWFNSKIDKIAVVGIGFFDDQEMNMLLTEDVLMAVQYDAIKNNPYWEYIGKL